MSEPVRIPHRALVVLVGPSAAGKSTWADRWWRDDQVVSSDGLRALVGTGPHDQRAGTDAFDVLDLVIQRRLKRGLLTVVDSLGLDDDRRAGWIALARRHGRPVHAIAFDVPAAECRSRNKARADQVPSRVLTRQLERFDTVKAHLADEFDEVHQPGPVRIVATSLTGAPEARRRHEETPMTLRFGLQLPSFTWPGERTDLGPQLADVARRAEDAGFSSLWVMDHFVQIPFAGREWEPMLESYTTLGFLAASTARIELGTMVTGITYRNLAHLGKIVATLDVLSGGRARCGLGAAWFEREHRAYGWDFPPIPTRYELLEDALELLPLMWGPGSPAYQGRRIDVAEAICYPRPVQEHVPILVGGSGERRTLRLVARHADACNLFGEPDVVAHKVGVLRQHCADVDRDPAEISVTQLSTVLCTPDEAALAARVSALAPDSAPPEDYAERVNAGTVEDHVGRFRAFAEVGVDEAIVSLPDVALEGSLECFAEVIARFAGSDLR